MVRSVEKTYKIVDLVEAVEAIPPTSTAVTERFAGKCFLMSKDGKTLHTDEVISIVDNWPNGCEAGRNKFLASVGVKRKITTVEFETIQLFYYDAYQKWHPVTGQEVGLVDFRAALMSELDLTNVTTQLGKSVSEAHNVVFRRKKLNSFVSSMNFHDDGEGFICFNVSKSSRYYMRIPFHFGIGAIEE